MSIRSAASTTLRALTTSLVVAGALGVLLGVTPAVSHAQTITACYPKPNNANATGTGNLNIVGVPQAPANCGTD